MAAELDFLYVKLRPGKAVTRLVTHLFFQGRPLTTRHRWLNRFLLAGMKVVASMPQIKTVERPIFIVGMGRSGSTILGKTLSVHRDVGWLNEPKLIWYSIDPREDVNGNFYPGPAQYRFTSEDVPADAGPKLKRIYGFYLAVTGSKRIVDKYPELVYRAAYVRELFPDARFIFLVRNGWDSLSSTARWSKQQGREVDGVLEDWWGADRRKWNIMVDELVASDPDLSEHKDEIGNFTRQEEMAAVEWIVCMREGLKMMSSFPEATHLIRYEDLTQNPQKSLPELTEFCGLPEDKTFLEYAGKTLVAGRTHDRRVSLPPCIEPAFLKTLAELGYS